MSRERTFLIAFRAYEFSTLTCGEADRCLVFNHRTFFIYVSGLVLTAWLGNFPTESERYDVIELMRYFTNNKELFF